MQGVSVPFDAGRGLMQSEEIGRIAYHTGFQYPSMRVVD